MTQPIPANRQQGHFEVVKSYSGQITRNMAKRRELGFRHWRKYPYSWVDGVSLVIAYVVCDSGTYTMLTGCDVLWRNYQA